MPLDFVRWFDLAHDRAPHPWQAALAAPEAPGHRLIRVPTGFGKTLGVLSAWLYHRVVRGHAAWPARLIWTLPMRTLVEQTEREVQRALERLGLLWDGEGDHAGKVGVHVLMGGSDAGDWHNHPADAAVLIGTQDMLLSRALNRGYGAARARWPIDFGLLSSDALWVLDEVQLMGVGFATALQLAAFRQRAPALRPSFTWAMSATLQPGWLARSPDTGALRESFSPVALQPGDEALPVWAGTTKPAQALEPMGAAAVAARVLAEHGQLSAPAPLTLVVLNTVDRARELYDELVKRANGPTVHLIHSRFRGHERRAWTSALLAREGAGDRVIVATQVVEAGVDLSADLLFTELCPWPSLVQRAGRLARRGGRGAAFVLGLELPKQAPPYDPDELNAAAHALTLLDDLSPAALARFEEAHAALLPGLYPFDPPHLVLEDEVAELFDTSADLSGGDLDVSRFIREGVERDLSVAWVDLAARGEAGAPPRGLRPGRDALCAVPFLTARDWLCGKKSGGIEPKRLKVPGSAFVWDYLKGAWRVAERADLRPGAQVLLDSTVGGYDPSRGLDPSSRRPVPEVGLLWADPQEAADASADQDDLSMAAWQTIGFHGAAVAAVARHITGAMSLPSEGARLQVLLDLAARWHDLGKAHPAFQGAIQGQDRPARADLAKAPAAAWSTQRCIYQWTEGAPPRTERRPGLRHELASALALFDVLLRWAPASHPARLGALAAFFDGALPRADGEGQPSLIEQEILDLSADDFDLVAFLVLAHHGKVRARMDAGPADQDAAVRGGELPIRGVVQGDRLPPTDLAGPDGGVHGLPASHLSLEPAVLGLSRFTGRSWTERVQALRARWGPFALAWMEALLRAADVRASRDRGLRDPALDPDKPRSTAQPEVSR